MTAQSRVVAEASLDDLRSQDVRFLQQAAGRGRLHLRVPSDGLVTRLTGAPPGFPAVERLFLAESIRWVASAELVERPVTAELDALAARGATLLVPEAAADAAVERAVRASGSRYEVVSRAECAGLPWWEAPPPPLGTPRVVVTGCFDWLHSGHIRFFMDAAAYGALYVVVGSDRNVASLKGAGHPLQREEERRYMIAAMRMVHACLVSSGTGWMDAAPEIDHIKPSHYVVNEDGDRPEKAEFCRAHGIEYVVLERIPHQGLPARSSTDLRGF
jgi:cytidyltransferase-like protein